MTKAAKTRRYSAESKAAFQKMLYHKLAMWDEALRLEQLLGAEFDTGDLDYLASFFGPADGVLALSPKKLTAIMRDWMSKHCSFCNKEEVA